MRLFTIFFCLSMFVGKAQSNAEILIYNILLGASTSGLGSAINKSPEEKWNQAFYNGVWKGAIGGTFLYGGKQLSAGLYTVACK